MIRVKDLIYNETSESITQLIVEKDHQIYLECPKCQSELTFKVFFGDSIYIIPDPCPKCSKVPWPKQLCSALLYPRL